MRVSELANELGKTSKEILKLLRRKIKQLYYMQHRM